ncbi:unnamed protein product [Candida verbasci]|uniref:Signal recognition particle receptor subunit alpha homolog n=1 Tax=Candida verbasci TaxID=1227364 RepID=A0A9W4TYD1_9ASCO|nr:unnamed protein product [Candida verbasci]
MSLIIFKPSGKIEYQFNNKIYPFNEFISNLINKININNLDTNFNSTIISNKKFYNYIKDDIYIALYFDSITTIDIDKIKSTLINIYKTYKKFEDEPDDKMSQMIALQFNQLMKLKIEKEPIKEKKPVKKEVIKEVTSKKMRKWDASGEIIESTDQILDFSTDKGEREFDFKVDDSAFTRNNDMVLVNELNDILNEEEEEEEQVKTGFFSKVSSYFGSSVDIDTISKNFLDHLISKNVTPQVAQEIINNMKTKLSKTKITEKVYKEALTNELTKVLTPNASLDLLQSIKSKKEPYVISIVGVNGVGKSTNLAKLAYWLLQNNLKVLICASDTFRSGAVEQLKIHVNNLKKLNDSIDLFQQGYGTADFAVQTAKNAIKFGKEHGYDVILVDTAGRTHSNTKLMAPLKKFGDSVNPDKIIMVAEALAGTDSVAQADSFKKAFGNNRHINYFIVSKVDTVGNLMGTLINLSAATNTSIIFIGTGQTYTDLKRLNIKQVVNSILN